MTVVVTPCVDVDVVVVCVVVDAVVVDVAVDKYVVVVGVVVVVVGVEVDVDDVVGVTHTPCTQAPATPSVTHTVPSTNGLPLKHVS